MPLLNALEDGAVPMSTATYLSIGTLDGERGKPGNRNERWPCRYGVHGCDLRFSVVKLTHYRLKPTHLPNKRP